MLEVFVSILSVAPKLFFNAKNLIVFCETLWATWSTSFDLSCAEPNSQISNKQILSFTWSVVIPWYPIRYILPIYEPEWIQWPNQFGSFSKRRKLHAFLSIPVWIRMGLVTVKSSSTFWTLVLAVKLLHVSQSSSCLSFCWFYFRETYLFFYCFLLSCVSWFWSTT